MRRPAILMMLDLLLPYRSTPEILRDTIRKRLVLMGLLVLALILFPFPVPAFAQSTYYVSPDGNDTTGSGTQGSPWRTISHAVSEVSSGDIIKVMDDDNVSSDDYTENINVNKSLTIERYDSDATNPQVKAFDPGDYVFNVTASDVILSGLDIYGSNGAGIALFFAANCTIEENRCGWDSAHKNEHGILSVWSSNNTIASNTACSNTRHGIYLNASFNNNLTSNTTNNNSEDGICLEANSSSNNLTSNTAIGNEYGIFVSASSNNIITSGTMNQNNGRVDGDGIMLSDSSGNTLSNNTTNDNPGDGIEFYNSSNNNLTNNTVINNSGWGIRINHSSSNNTLANNTVNGSNKGIVLQDSSNGNRCYLNSLSGNVEDNVYVEGSSGNTWESPTKFSYRYGGSPYKGYLGNYYSDHGKNDANSDGIGDTAYSGTGFTDSFPLFVQHSNYPLMTWYLLSNPTMCRSDFDDAGGTCTIPSGGNVVWAADEVAQQELVFPAGAMGDQTCWTYQLTFSESLDASTFTLTMGYADSDGSNFTDVGGKPNVTLSGSAQVFNGVLTNTQSFTVPSGKYLALKIANSSGTARNIMGSASWSYVSASHASPAYPVPDLPAIVLVSLGLVAFGGMFCARNGRGQKTPSG